MKRVFLRCWLVALAMSAASAGAGAVVGETFAVPPVSESVLDASRGGFGSGGLVASFGFERTIAVNGEVVYRSSVHVADLTRLGVADALALRAALGGVSLVQNGSGTFLSTPADLPAGVAVIQNSLDGQSIRQSTAMSLGSNSLGLARGLAAAAVLRDALNAPLVRP